MTKEKEVEYYLTDGVSIQFKLRLTRHLLALVLNTVPNRGLVDAPRGGEKSSCPDPPTIPGHFAQHVREKKIFSILAASFLSVTAMPQSESYVQQGEFGITAGAAHYFGDLNTRAGFNRPKPSFGLFFRKQFSKYIGVRLAGRYAQLGYSDRYSKNDYQRTRNLSFNTNVWEIAVQGDFNFFKFVPNDERYFYTPYITLGVGAFSYDPYAFLNGKKEFLRPLGTEGQTVGLRWQEALQHHVSLHSVCPAGTL